jgi:hypothetical protein
MDPGTLSFMESRFGHDFSRVRVHTDARAAEAASALDAHAFTVGRDVMFDTGEYQPESHEGRVLLAHELTHVLQQTGSSQVEGVRVSSSGPRVARQKKPKSSDPVLSTETDDRTHTLVQVHIAGHASPRWRGADSARESDDRNAELSEARAQAVKAEIEAVVRDALPDHDLAFRYDYSPADPHNEPSGVIVGTESQGSNVTLGEAGDRGRTANDPEMRRVDVFVDLSSFTDTARSQEVEETHQEPTATRDWAVKVALSAKVQLGAGVGYINIKLKNCSTDEEVIGHGWFSVGGAGIGKTLKPEMALEAASVAVDWGDYTRFTTKKPANFSDFDPVNFYLRTHGLSLGAIGYEVARLTFFDLPGGDVWAIDVGGWNSGKFGVDVASLAYGAIFLERTPSNVREVVSKRTNVELFESSSIEQSRHRVLFQTGKSTVRPDEVRKLSAYVWKAVRNYQSE